MTSERAVVQALVDLPDSRGSAIDIAAKTGLSVEDAVVALRALKADGQIAQLPIDPVHQRWVAKYEWNKP